jgi:hypothetical protein
MYYKSNCYCQKCKAWDVPLMKNAKTTSRSAIIQSYMCRECTKNRVKKYYDNNTEKIRQIIYKSIRKHKSKQRARNQLNEAVSAGRITRPEVCEECGAGGKIQGHHEDYSKPLEVNWLCISCHANIYTTLEREF